MKTILTTAFTSLSLCIALTSCTKEEKPYSLVYEGGKTVTVILPEPDYNYLKQDSLVFNGFSLDDIERDIYNDLTSKGIQDWGGITLYIIPQKLQNAGNIWHEELKNSDYASYQGKITSQIESFFFNNY